MTLSLLTQWGGIHSNIRAIKAYEKVGFKTVDILKKSWTMPNGIKVDMLLMELNKKADCH